MLVIPTIVTFSVYANIIYQRSDIIIMPQIVGENKFN